MASRAVTVAAVLTFVLASVLGGTVGVEQDPGSGPRLADGARGQDAPDDVHLVRLDGTGGDRLWPYTSRRPDFGSRTLAINLVVYDDPGTVEQRLQGRVDDEWTDHNDSTANFSVEVDDEQLRIVWTPAHGARRYSYAERSGEGTWLLQRYQLHAGTYLGHREHVRAYAPAADSEWTALQAHSEYWDWFRLRHTVTDVWPTARSLERDFADQPRVTDVERAYRTDGGPHRRGITVVRVAGLAALGLAVPALGRRFEELGDRLDSAGSDRPRSVTLFAVALLTPLAVRVAGVGLEAALGGLDPKVVAAPLYVALVVGLPVGVYRLSDGVPIGRAFALASLGFLAGAALDFVALGVVTIPEAVVRQRLSLAAGLGLVAAGGTGATDRRTLVLVAGFATWWGTALAVVFQLA